MMLTPSITLRGFGSSPALEADIGRRIAKLETFYPSIIGCRVLVEHAHRRHHTGNRFHVRIDLTVPGSEIVIAHDASLHGEAQHRRAGKARKAREPDPQRKRASVAVREAFESARRRLQDYARRQRGDVKSRIVDVEPTGGAS
jgi:ribosome-associated translation inhibitor RaiA